MDRKQIADYLWNKAPSHLKDNQLDEEKDTFKLFEIWAGRGYEVREAMKTSRLNRFPQTASKEALYLIGKERQIEKFDFETEEEFRQRVINALDWHRLKGTTKGIKTILKIYGFEDVKITPALEENKGQWAEFNLLLDNVKDISQVKDIIKLVNLVKPAHEKLSSVSDGSCRKIAVLDKTKLNRNLLSSADGIKVDNTRVCFTVKNKNTYKYIENSLIKKKYTFRSYILFPTSRQRLDTFKLSNLSKLKKTFSSHWIQYINHYKLNTNTRKRIYTRTNFSFELSISKLSTNKGFEKWTKDYQFNLSRNKLDKTITRKMPVIYRLLQTSKQLFINANLSIKDNQIRIFSFVKNTRRSNKLSGKEINNQRFKTRLHTSIKQIKRNWTGNWIGNWKDNYKITGGSLWHS